MATAGPLLRAGVSARVDSITTITRQPRLYHAWPTMIRRRQDGMLLAAYSGGREGHHCPFGRVELIRSADEGRTWSWPQVVIDTAIDDRDAGILETARGTLLVCTFTATSYERALAEGKGWDAERLERWQAVAKGLTAAEGRR
jgi:sialidase-1